MSRKNTIAWSVVALFVLLIGISSFNRQPRDEVLVREPGYRLYSQTGPIVGQAGKEWEYAVLAENVYVGRWRDGVDASTEVVPVTLGRHRAACDDTTRIRRIPLADWTRWKNFPSDSLIDEARKGGLFFEVWETRSSPLRLAVVFRGTDGWSDWLSNLHWFTRFIPILEDQYSFVSSLVGKEFSDRILADPIKYPNPESLPLVSVGHSLGGGLAQHFAYALRLDPRVPRVSQVYAFDPSPVTGWSSVPSVQESFDAGAGVRPGGRGWSHADAVTRDETLT